MPDLELEQDWHIPEEDLELKFVRSPGPGGQNVNKVATKAELRFKLAQSLALNSAQKRRLAAAFPSRVTQAGDFILTADRFRSQQRNQADALSRLAEMIRSIRRPPKRRIPTRATAGSKRRRLEQKRARGELKKLRRSRDDD